MYMFCSPLGFERMGGKGWVKMGIALRFVCLRIQLPAPRTSTVYCKPLLLLH